MTHKRNNRVALITGASSGIGLELTKRLLSEGWQVIALIRSAFPSDDSLVQDCLRSQQLRIYTADLSDFTDLHSSLNQVKKHENHIDRCLITQVFPLANYPTPNKGARCILK